MSRSLVSFNFSDGIARITFNRPEAANAVNTAFARDFSDTVNSLKDLTDLRVVLVDAKGPVFCAGGDLKDFHSAGNKIEARLSGMIDLMHAASETLYNLHVPVLASVKGSAGGIGLSILCACDFVIAARSAKFALGYLGAGLTPDGGSTYFLPRLIGQRRALDLMLLNRSLSADEACEWGLINWAVGEDELSDQTEKIVTRLSRGPTSAFGVAKDLVHKSAETSLLAQLHAEKLSILKAVTSPNGQEGIAAFTEKRRPKFTNHDLT